MGDILVRSLEDMKNSVKHINNMNKCNELRVKLHKEKQLTKNCNIKSQREITTEESFVKHNCYYEISW
jgi:hypothetical protein